MIWDGIERRYGVRSFDAASARDKGMTDISWTIKGREFVHCNCAYGCPCQFNALPTQGNCRAVAAIDKAIG